MRIARVFLQNQQPFVENYFRLKTATLNRFLFFVNAVRHRNIARLYKKAGMNIRLLV